MAVRDAGPGIDPAVQDRIFDRFWQGDQAGPARRSGHAGLGLAIVRQIAESHGGTVTLHSAPGAGSTFVLWLPAPAGTAGDTAVRPPDSDPLARLLPA
jgi:signal transduction histidine kinase